MLRQDFNPRSPLHECRMCLHPMPQHPKPSAKNEQGEFGKFDDLLNKLLSVPHSKIKAELEAEKKRPKKPRDRARRKHAFRDVTDAD
jgi:hypothetical protein